MWRTKAAAWALKRTFSAMPRPVGSRPGGLSTHARATTLDLIEGLSADQRERVARALRVNHAGEYGAVRIYEGQLAVLGRTSEAKQLADMKQHETEHLRLFRALLPEQRVRPSAILPIWDLGGFVLGAGSAMLGKGAAYAVTVAVESVITAHYDKQLQYMSEDLRLGNEHELVKAIQKFRDEEQEHHDVALDKGAKDTALFSIINTLTRGICHGAIAVSKRL